MWQGQKSWSSWSIARVVLPHTEMFYLPLRADIVEEVFEDIADNSLVMEDINQNKIESEESKGDTSAEYEDNAVKRFQRTKMKNWIPLTNLDREADKYGLLA